MFSFSIVLAFVQVPINELTANGTEGRHKTEDLRAGAELTGCRHQPAVLLLASEAGYEKVSTATDAASQVTIGIAGPDILCSSTLTGRYRAG